MADIDYAIVDPSRVLGIDTSHWTGIVDWQRAKANGIKFAIIKAADGLNTKIRYFPENYRGAKDAGILVGAYSWLYPSTVCSPGTQARKFLELLRDYPMDIPVGPDFEWTSPKNPTASDLYGYVVPFEDGYGKLAVIYSALGYWNQFGSLSSFWALRYLWQAHYTPATFSVIRPWLRETILQFTEKGRGADYGVPLWGEKACDLNYFNGTLAELYAWAGKPFPGDGGVVVPPVTPPIVVPPPAAETSIMKIRTRYSDLRKRSGPGVTYQVLGVMTPGIVYDVVQVQGSWARLMGDKREWTSLDYCEKLSGGTTPTAVIEKIVTGYPNLYKRSGPGKTYATLGFLTAGQRYDIVAIQGEWGRLAGDAELWTCLSYCTKVA